MKMKAKIYAFLVILGFTVFGCKKEEVVRPPLEVSTGQVSGVEWSTATISGFVGGEGGSFVSLRGVVWGKKSKPTVDSSSKTSDGVGVGEFVSKLTNLEPGTKYYVRTYAINYTDTMYGSEMSFTTYSWTPKDIKNVWDWWNSQYGIKKTGNLVQEWKGVNGFELEPGDEYNKALVDTADKNWGNQPSVVMNPNFKNKDCGYYTKLNLNKTSKTAILVSRVINRQTKNMNALLAVNSDTYPRFGIWGLPGQSYMFYDSRFPYQYGGNQYKDSTYQFIRISYDRTNGFTEYFVNNSPDFKNKLYTYQTLKGMDFVNGDLSVGHYSDKYGTTPKMSVVEVLFVDGILSEQELDMYGKYLKYKYKL
jgi:hypothetical protein